MSITSVPSDNTTLVAVLEGLEADGYGEDFQLGSGPVLECPACGHETSDVHIDWSRRMEGASDPADMAMVFAVRCPECDATGRAVVRFGPEAGPDEAELLRELDG